MNTALTLTSKTIRLRRSDPPVRATASAAPQSSVPVIVTPPAPTLAPAPAVAPIPAAKKVNLAEHPLAQHALMTLRNKHTAPAQFRQVSDQLLLVLALEATRNLPTRDDLVETHSTTHTGQVLAKPVVFLSVTRSGLGLAHTVADFFPGVLVGTVTLERKPDQVAVEPRLHIVNAPALGDARVILFDPVVATGMSATVAINFLRRSGATDITLVSFLMSLQGLSRLQSAQPDLCVWTAGIDSEWDAKRGPLPGLGNFSERLYG